jgi:hypothetical protein
MKASGGPEFRAAQCFLYGVSDMDELLLRNGHTCGVDKQ